MKVLHAFNQDLNPYVDVVQDGLRQAGVEVISNTRPFWEGKGSDFDLVHFQWPETLFDWRAPSEIELILLKQRLAELKGKVPLVLTHHNTRSNHCTTENESRLVELYDLFFDTADAVIHLGEASLPSDGGTKKHCVIPIPVYEKLYGPYLDITQEEARRRLGLPADKKIFLCFGNFRDATEHRLVAEAYARIRNRQTCLDAPKWFKPRDLGFSPLQPFFCLRSLNKIVQTKKQGIRAGAIKIMDDEQVALHFAACDVVFLQRTHQLNSGNLPMAYLFGKVAVGPDIGNIGFWLQQTGNPVFNPQDPASTAQALEESLRLCNNDQGKTNRDFALAHWHTDRIGAEHAKLYQSLI